MASKSELDAIIDKGFHPLAPVPKRSILDLEGLLNPPLNAKNFVLKFIKSKFITINLNLL